MKDHTMNLTLATKHFRSKKLYLSIIYVEKEKSFDSQTVNFPLKLDFSLVL